MRNALDAPGSAAYSPSGATPDQDASLPLLFRQRYLHGSVPGNNEPGDWANIAQNGANLRPPDPTVGGRPGLTNVLGWTKGLLPFNWGRQPLRGAVLAVPNMGANPVVGHVGFSTRSQRLANRVAALSNDYTPQSNTVNQSFKGWGM